MTARMTRSDMAMVRSFGGRRLDRLHRPNVDLDRELLDDLRELTNARVCWPVA